MYSSIDCFQIPTLHLTTIYYYASFRGKNRQNKITYMKKNFLLLLSVVALSLSFAACSKDDADDKQESKLVGTWMLDASSIDESIFEDMEGFEACQLSSTITFNSNGTLTGKDGCTGEDMEDEIGTTKWHAEDSKLKITPSESINLPIEITLSLKIITLDSNKLVLEIPDFSGQVGGPIRITLNKVK